MAENNSYSLLKLTAAIMVIVSHIRPISTGEVNSVSSFLGKFAVSIFFIISGYFITKSCIGADAKTYFVKRIKRIFPPLIIMLFITTFLIAPIFYDKSLLTYLNGGSILYFVKNSLLITTHKISGVFANNVYSDSINGSLWTIPVEFLCYIGIFILYKLKILEKKNLKLQIGLLGCGLLVAVLLINNALFIPLSLALIFYMSGLFYIHKDKIKFDLKLTLGLTVIFIIATILGYFDIAKITILPYIVLSIGYNFKLHIPVLEDITYEIYLYSFFIKQCVCALFNGHMNMYLNLVIALPIILIIAYFTNKLNKLVMKHI